VTAVENPAADRAAAYGLEAILADGNDADEMHEVARRTVERARRGDGPSLVEAKTYRHTGHSRADPGKYRPDEEVEVWLARDPIPKLQERQLAAGVDQSVFERIESAAEELVERATEEAKAAPLPDPAILETELWADGGAAWRS
jgi:pyruvate dehydrogenase E1 component alpha subunit